MKRKTVDAFVIGMALFSMFFGAGNLIFPPYLGMTSGPQWLIGFLCFFMADIGLAFATIVAMINSNGHMSEVTGPLGRVPSLLVNIAIILCIGPLFATPRTAATTFEMFVVPVTGAGGFAASLISSAVYFAVVVLLTIRSTKVVDILGKILTPFLFIGLIVLITVGVAAPLGPVISQPMIGNVVKEGIVAGYQAMDVFGGLVFAIIIVSAVQRRGYSKDEDKIGVCAMACAITGIGLFLVYGGLTYLGATASTMYGMDVNRAQLLVQVTQRLLGQGGVMLLGVVVALACLTTAIGLTASAAAYFEELTNGKLKYKHMVIALASLSLLVANLGLSKIISIAVPVLSLLYPSILVLVFLSLFKTKITNPYIHRSAALVALAVSCCGVLNDLGAPVAFTQALPLAEYGLQWVAPSLIAGVIGAFIPQKTLALNPE